MTAIIAPAPKPSMRSAFLKLGARRYLVISTLMVAVLLDIHDGHVREARIAIGACSAAAKRIAEAEARLIGAPALYRLQTALVATRRALDACLRGEAGGLI